MNQIVEYSEDEIATLREIYASTETVESQAHRLPRRSFDSIEAKAHAIGLVKARGQSVLCLIHELMSDGEPRTIREVVKAVGGRKKYVGEQLRLLADGVRFHVHAYIGVHRCYVFKAGPGTNAVRPPAAHTPAKVYSARFRERNRVERPVKAKREGSPRAKAKPNAAPAPTRASYDPVLERLKDEKYRLPAARMRQADRVVFDAISSMARVGSQTA
ncbi:hypothetical protein [Paraburkholderia bryophila]|uniref:Uncharacterized protein n=1 Tax=Paraburkholderia bryophila TaxID=420952 RepID=A0A7Z0B5S9_9BURK|nr:hypothetical protein [Paraburkholderia bryophila]NYH21408.1 hypothetical protein [Paraburkholderia bryophila]